MQLFGTPLAISLPGSSVHRILQTRILEWVAIPFSRGSSCPRDRTMVSHRAGRFFALEPLTELQGAQIPGQYLVVFVRVFLDEINI